LYICMYRAFIGCFLNIFPIFLKRKYISPSN
jgi:hypothetical protein